MCTWQYRLQIPSNISAWINILFETHLKKLIQTTLLLKNTSNNKYIIYSYFYLIPILNTQSGLTFLKKGTCKAYYKRQRKKVDYKVIEEQEWKEEQLGVQHVRFALLLTAVLLHIGPHLSFLRTVSKWTVSIILTFLAWSNMIAQLERELKKYPYEYKVKWMRIDNGWRCSVLASVSPPNQTFISHGK